jgi:hypothetical protein
MAPSFPDAPASSESGQNPLVSCSHVVLLTLAHNEQNSGSGFFMNSQNIIITGGTFVSLSYTWTVSTIDRAYFIRQILNVRGEHGASGRESPLKSKGEVERYAIPSTSDQHGFIDMSTSLDELSYPPSQEETRDAEHVVANGRKNWKTLRGKGETVWPPLL